MAATTPRKRAPRAPRVAPAPVGVIQLDEDDADTSIFEERTALFAVAGVTYEARTTFSASEALRYSRLARTQGLDAAVDFALATALGADGFNALMDYKYLTKEKVTPIIKQVVGRFDGQAYDPK